MHETARKLYEDSFGDSPTVLATAPGRVEVLGNHTDYNEGYVLSFAIDKGIAAAAAQSNTGEIELVSSHYGSRIIAVEEAVRQTKNTWMNYPLGVYSVLRDAGYPVKPFCMAIHGNVPLGAGLSSSAALEVASAMALAKLFGFEVEGSELAKHCQRAEHTFAGTQCGLLDQFSSVFGRKDTVLFIDFRSLEHRTAPLPRTDVCVAITTSGVSHSLVESAYNDRRAECARAAQYFARNDPSETTLRDVSMEQLVAARGQFDDVAWRRAIHVVGEDERVLKGMELLGTGDLAGFGALLWESHDSSRANFENSCPELDALVEIARGIEGVYGSRLTGGGFGGATLALLDASCAGKFERSIRREYQRRTGREAIVYFTSIADGARVLDTAP